MTKFQLLHNIFPVYAHEVIVENEYEKVGVRGMLDEYYDRHEFKPFTVEECVNAFIDDVDEAFVFENYYYMVIGSALISVFATEWGTYFDVRKEAYISIARVKSYAKRIK